MVWDFHLDDVQWKNQIISAPARTSKSFSSSPEATHDFFPLLDPEAYARGEYCPVGVENRIWLVGTSYDMIKEWDYCWSHLIDRKLIEKFGGKIETAQNNPKQGNMVIVAQWPFRTPSGEVARSIIEGKSASNEQTLQSEEIRTCILSEAADHDRRMVEKYLAARCSRIIYPTTPKRGAMWLHDMIVASAERPELGIKHYEFSRFCNPTYDHERYEKARLKAELTYGQAENDPGFMEQFEGKWTFEGGKVLPFRWVDEPERPPCNVVSQAPTWVADATFFVSTDYGYNDPAVALFWAVGIDGRKCIISEIYESGLEPQEFVRRIKERVEALRIEVQYYLGDPQQPFVTEILRKHGLPIYDRMKPGELRDRAAGFERLRDELSVDPAVGEPKIIVHKSCENTIREWKQIRFKDNTTKEFGEGAIVGDDHATDAARYFLMSRPKPRAEERDWLADFERNQREAALWRKRARRHQSPLMGVNPSAFVEAY